ncbi:Dolichyl-phosphate-mannose-protein mannosyltransferase [uncultured archaeon]|nr:Dolichyl-phosphate-mannose-protein mannosyltransferase [uncultured archaeon]
MKPLSVNYKLCIYAAIALFFVMEIFVIFNNHPAWWDEAVYISMGKYMFSGGNAGMWEEIRPPLLPVLSGILWKLGANPLLGGRIIVLLLSAGTIFLTYLIGKRAFGAKEGILAAVMLAFTNAFFYYSALFLSDIASLFFALAAIYVFISGKSRVGLFISGALAALSFLSRFPQALVAIAVILSIIAKKTEADKSASGIRRVIDSSLAFISGFMALVVPFLLSNYYLYGSALRPFVAANRIITESYSWLYDLGYMYYFRELATQNLFLVFSIAGLAYLAKDRLWQIKEKAVVFITPLILFLYFITLNHKEARYVIIFLPYMFIISSFGFFEIKRRLGNYSPYGKAYSLVSLIIVAGILGGLLIQDAGGARYVEGIPAFYRNISTVDFGKGPVFSTTPGVGIYSDAQIKPIYYSLTYAQNNYEAMHNSSGFVVFNTCDFPCQDGDTICPRQINSLVDGIKNNSKTIYYAKEGDCEHYILEKTNSN